MPALRRLASPRGSLGLYRAAQALAAVRGDNSVTMDHVRAVLDPVLTHRLLLRPDAGKDYPDAAAVVRELAAKVPPG